MKTLFTIPANVDVGEMDEIAMTVDRNTRTVREHDMGILAASLLTFDPDRNSTIPSNK